MNASLDVDPTSMHSLPGKARKGGAGKENGAAKEKGAAEGKREYSGVPARLVFCLQRAALLALLVGKLVGNLFRVKLELRQESVGGQLGVC